MACALNVAGPVPTGKKGDQVTVKLVAATTTLKRASVNGTDITSSIDQTNKSVAFNLSGGTNTVVVVLFPPPAPEPIRIVEDCGGGNTQPILSFGPGIHASATFDIIAS